MNPVPKNRTHHNTSHLSYFYNALCCRCAWQWRSSLAVMPGTSRTTTTYVWTIMASSWRSQIICNAKRWYNGIVRIFRPSATPHAHWPTRPTINWTICWSIPSTSSSTVMCQKWHAPIGSEYWCWWPISGRMARTHWRYLHQWRIHRACESYTFYCIHHMHRNNNCNFAFSAGSKNSARCPRRSETKFYPNTPNSWSFAIHSNDSFLRIETNWRVICPALGIFKHALANRLSNRSVQTRPPNHWIGVTTLHLTNLSCTYWRPNWAWIIRQISRSTSIGSQSTNCAIRATSNTMLLVSFYASFCSWEIDINDFYLHFKYTGKYETLLDDSALALHMAGADNLTFPTTQRTSGTSDRLRAYFSQVPISVTKNLYRLYEDDFRLFGYSLEDVLGYELG